MKIQFHGHACISIELQDKTRIIVDPWISGNPKTNLIANEVKADYILITHAHNDHVGDSELIARNNNATIICNLEMADYFDLKGHKVHGMQPGGSFKTLFGRLKMTPAIHGSTLTLEDGSQLPLGLAAGFLIMAENHCIYHAGDTALFSDMRLIGEETRIDYAFLPIGDNYTMGVKDASKAAYFLQPRRVVPIHYNTFELIEQDPTIMKAYLPEKMLHIMEVGDEINL